MHEGLVLVVLLALGFGAFIFSIVYFVVRVLGGLFRGVGRLFRGSTTAGPRVDIPAHGVSRVCPRPQCRRVERRAARFCGQCGARMSGHDGNWRSHDT